MKKIFTLITLFFVIVRPAKSQVVINELYTDPGSGKSEFFELYNTNPGGSLSMDNYTMVTYFNVSGNKGFYVLDMPDMPLAARGYFVGSSASPFNYQGVTNSTATDFSWNNAISNGSLKKWVQGGLNLLDGNLSYDQAAIPANFNDFFNRVTGSGSSYSVFLYRDGVLINSFLGGTGGSAAVLPTILAMPPLFVDMAGSSADFTITFSSYGSIPLENCTQDAGSDNGFIREFDGACASWKKSSSAITHTPHASNGSLMGSTTSSISISAAITPGTALTGSIINSDVVSAPASYFPIELQIFKDNGSVASKLDGTDSYLTSNTENVVSDGPFHNTFFPYNSHILIAAKTSAGCIDKIMYIPNSIALSVKLISFDGNRVHTATHLNWDIEENESAERFEVQKSVDGINFTTEAIVMSTDVSGRQQYSYNTSSDGTIIYRLRIFNKSSTVSISKNVAFTSKENSATNLSVVNPVSDRVMMFYDARQNSNVQISVTDMTGRIVLQSSIKVYSGKNEINIPLNSSVKAGTYIIYLNDGGERYTGKFIK
jgi:hypothetical protein